MFHFGFLDVFGEFHRRAGQDILPTSLPARVPPAPCATLPPALLATRRHRLGRHRRQGKAHCASFVINHCHVAETVLICASCLGEDFPQSRQVRKAAFKKITATSLVAGVMWM